MMSVMKSSRAGQGGSKGRRFLLVFGCDIRHNVLVEKLQNQRNAVGKDQVLRHEFELVDVIQLEMFQQQQQDGGHGLDQNLLVPIDVDAQLHRLQNGHTGKSDARKGGKRSLVST